jgi:hypothetical protein
MMLVVALHSLTMLLLSCSCVFLQAGRRKPEHGPGGGAALANHAGYSILLMRTPTGREEEA